MSGGGFIDNIVDAVVDPVKDLGSWIDDKVNEEIPGGWYTVAAVTGATYFGAEAIAAGNAAEAAAIAEGATAAEAAAAGASAATATEAAAAGSGFGLNPASTGGYGLSTSTAGTGINTSALNSMGYLGGTGNLAVGTAGLTAEQIAQAQLAGQVGSNVSSGLGYLGGVEALPAGTAGMSGVTAPASLSLGDAQRALRLGQSLLSQPQMPTPQGMQMPQVAPRGMVDYSPILSLLQQRVSTPNVYSLLG